MHFTNDLFPTSNQRLLNIPWEINRTNTRQGRQKGKVRVQRFPDGNHCHNSKRIGGSRDIEDEHARLKGAEI